MVKPLPEFGPAKATQETTRLEPRQAGDVNCDLAFPSFYLEIIPDLQKVACIIRRTLLRIRQLLIQHVLSFPLFPEPFKNKL